MSFRSEKLPIIIKSLNSFLLYSMHFFWAPYLLSIGITGWQLGIIFGAFSLAGLINTLPSGFINDRVNSKKLVMLGVVLMSLFVFGVIITENFYVILAAFTIGGLGRNLFKISIDSFFLKSEKVQNDSKKIGHFLGASQFAYGAGVIASGYLQTFLPLKTIVLTISVLLLTNLILAAFLSSRATFSFKILEYKNDIFKKEILLFFVIFFLFALHFGSEDVAYGPFLKNNLGLSTKAMGLYIGLGVACMSLPAIIASRKVQNGSKSINLLYFGLLLSGAGYLMSAYPSLYPSFIGRVIHEIGDAVMFIFLYHGISKLFPSARLGGNLGVVIFVVIIGTTAGSLIFGPIGDKFGFEWPIILASISTLLTIPLITYYRHLIKH